MDQVATAMDPGALGALREADRAELRQAAAAAGGPAALLAARFPRLASACPTGLTEEALLAETVAWYEDAEARLSLCATCPATGGACHGSSSLFKQGQLPVWRAYRVERSRCERYREWRLRERLAISNVPDRYRGCTLVESERDHGCRLTVFKCKTPAMLATAAAIGEFHREMRSGGEPWLVVSGPANTGKTHLGCAVLRTIPIVLPRKHFWYSDMNELRFQMKAFNFASGGDDPMARLRDTEVLVFDNLDIARLAKDAWLMDRVEGVLYERWNRRRATLITTHGTFGDIVVAFPGITTLREAPWCSLA